MEAACLRHTDIPHTTKLFADFQYHFDRVKGLYPYSPENPESYTLAASRIAYPEDRRAALVAALRARNGNSASLELLAKPGTVAVVTGQQAGLFSGPAYTIYKALTAIALARRLTTQGLNAVPIFWVATEDHDLAEIDHTFVFGKDHQPVKLTATGTGEHQQPVGTIPLADVPLGQLRELFAPFPHGEEISALTAQAYTAGATFGSSFEGLVGSLLEGRGVLFVDPLDEPIRDIAAPFLRGAILRAPELKRNVLEQNKVLEAKGYHAQVHVEAHTSLFFLLDGKRRLTLRVQNGHYASSKDHRYTVEELAAEPRNLSPNALLRPVVQDYILPTVAYVGGPAELAYLAQSRVLYDELLDRMPVVLARASFTLLSARAEKLMKRYNLTVPCFFRGEECLRDKIAAKLMPTSLIEQFRTIQSQTGTSFDRLRTGLHEFDASLATALDKSRAKVLYQLSKMERKAAKEALNRDERATTHAHYLSGSVFPHKHPQERYYSILPFLAEHGLELIDTLAEAVNLECPDHKILTV